MPSNQLIEAFRRLLKEEPTILAAPEDVAYFRSLYRNRESGKEPPSIGKTFSEGKEILRSDKEGQAPCYSRIDSSLNPTAKDKNCTELPVPSQDMVLPKPQSLETPLVATECKHDPSSPLKAKEAMIPNPAERSEIKPKIAEPGHPKAPVQKDQILKKELAASVRGIESPSFSMMKSLLAKIAPELAIFDTVPSDATAKKIATRWKTKNQSAPISVLSGNELPQYKKFLEEIAAALDVYFGSARIVQADPIEKEKQWEPFLASEGLKLIVVCDATLWQLQNLRQFYKETPTQGIRTLGKIPLCLLPDLSLYFKDPLLKRSLWKALCLKCS